LNRKKEEELLKHISHRLDLIENALVPMQKWDTLVDVNAARMALKFLEAMNKDKE
jgi:hypothetical protein